MPPDIQPSIGGAADSSRGPPIAGLRENARAQIHQQTRPATGAKYNSQGGPATLTDPKERKERDAGLKNWFNLPPWTPDRHTRRRRTTRRSPRRYCPTRRSAMMSKCERRWRNCTSTRPARQLAQRAREEKPGNEN